MYVIIIKTPIRKAFKIAVRIAILIVLLFLGTVLAVQLPGVQTLLAQKAMKKLSGKIDGELVIGRIHASPYDGVVIQDIAILDKNAADVPWRSREDTLFRADYISATFSTRGLLSTSGIKLKSAKVRNGLFVLTSEPPTIPGMKVSSNLARVFRLMPKEHKKEKSSKEVLHITNVEIDGMEYRMKNCRTPDRFAVAEGAINWDDLDVCGIRIKGRDFSIKGGIIGGTVDSMTFTESSGFTPANISGDAKVGNGATIVRDLRITDADSDISMTEYRMTYENTKSFSDFLNKVRIDAQLLPSRVSPKTISYFASGMKRMNFDVIAEGGFHGTVADFTLEDFSFRNTRDAMHGTVNGSLTGLPDVYGMVIDAKLENTDFNPAELFRFLRDLSPSFKVDPGKIARGQRFRIDGTVKGRLNDLAAKVRSTSAIGGFTADIDLHDAVDGRKPVRIEGNVSASNLDLGRILGSDRLGQITAFTRIGASLAKEDTRITIDTLAVGRLQALGYTYSNINGYGKYASDGLRAAISVNDPNLSLSAEASYMNPGENGQISLDIPRADLSAINLYRHGTAIASLSADGFINGTADGNRKGEISINDIILHGNDRLHRIGDLILAGELGRNSSDITVESPVITGQFRGDGTPVDFIRDFMDMALRSKVPAVFGEERGEASGGCYDLDLSIHDSQDLLSFFVPGLYIADNSNACIRISEEGQVNGTINSGRLAIKDKYLKGVVISLNNAEGPLNAEITAEELSVSPILTRDNRFMAFAEDNSIGLSFSYDNQTELDNKGELYVSCDLDRCSADSLDVHARILQSNIYLNSNAWTINPSALDVSGGHIRLDNFVLSSDSQSISVNGGFSKTYRDSLNLTLRQFNLASVNPFLGGKFDIGGLATGSATLLSPAAGNPGLQAGIRIDSTMVSGRSAGTMVLSSNWNEEDSGFNLSVRNIGDGMVHLDANALYVPAGRTLDASVNFDRFNLGYAEPLLASVFSELEGNLSGRIGLSGPMSDLDISSYGLRIEDGLLRVDFTNVPYRLSGPIGIDSRGVAFMNDDLTDRFGEKGKVSGGISWDHLRNMNFNTSINFSGLELLDLPEDAGQAFYGQVFGTGQVRISGPMNAIQLEVNADTVKEGDFHIPMSGALSASNSDLLTFKEPEVEYIIDPYELMMGRYRQQEAKAGSDMGILLKLNVDQGTQALVELDKASGNILSGRGTGSLDIEVRPSRDVFNLNGNYNLTSGNYHLDVLGIAQKDFAIQDGSTVHFSGDIMDSELDINAVYRTKASIGTLIADTTSTARRTVECGIAISDKIRNPQIGFSINVPDIDPTTQAMVENALNTDDKVQKQFISLLISSSFLPDEQSGIVNNTNMLNTTVTEIMAGQLNNILQKLDIPIDLGLDFQQGNNGKSIYDVAISTELFNSKVLVNGTIGNRQYGNVGLNSEEVVGDLDIEIKMDRTGALRFNLFSHSADQYTSYLDNSQRNGAGLTYQREFNSLVEFLKDIFKSRENRKAAENERLQQRGNIERTVIKIEE